MKTSTTLFHLLTFLLGLCLAAPLLAAQGDDLADRKQPVAPTDLAPDLWNELRQLSQRSDEVGDLTADFVQQKQTALLKEPLRSRGTVRVLGKRVRWETLEPQRSVLLVAGGEVRLYDPEAKRLEIYQVDQRLLDVAASPLPRMDVLAEHFRIERTANESGGDASIRLRLEPRAAPLADEIEWMELELEPRLGYLERLEIIDLDGDRTQIVFDNVDLDSGLTAKDVELEVPKGTEVFQPQRPGRS